MTEVSHNGFPSLGDVEAQSFLPDGWLGAALARSELRLAQDGIDPQVKPPEIAKYDECLSAYNQLEGQQQAVLSRLVTVMGHPMATDGQFVAHRLRFPRVEGSDRLTTVVHKVTVNLVHGKLLSDVGGYKSLQLTSNVILVPEFAPDDSRIDTNKRAYGGRLKGHVSFDSDAADFGFAGEEMQIEPFVALEQAAKQNLTDAARREALQGLAKEFVDLPAAPEGLSSAIFSSLQLNLNHDAALICLLSHNPETEEQALDLLDEAFKLDRVLAIRRMLSVKMDKLSADLVKFKLLERFN